MRGWIYGPGEGETLAIGPSSLVIKATSDATSGGFFLSETTLAAGMSGPPPHVHETLHDMFYVLEGTLTIRLDDEEHAAPAGTFACAPPGTVHAFRNDSAAPVRFLNFNIPGGWEQYMRDLAAASAGGTPPTPEQIAQIASRYDFKPV